MGSSTRDKILIAAAEMLGEDAGSTLSVRAVAARAGVSTGSLRHFFPTQRALRDAVLAGIYDYIASGDEIHDRSIPARDRLAGCLRQVLTPGGELRAAWVKVFEAFLVPEPTGETDAAYLAMEREGLRRVESWLAVLVREGALPEGDNTRRARFLNTVLNGLSIERALPHDDALLTSETETLYGAVDAVLEGLL
ncbi:TetR/AcrR family transcriptional regulator [Paractinoplanes lichenicola]|uniref:TetR/AcrR family transcriptional regulator n=1 Tax=Paractinoplanes lichenicola TaxID=2802976 RepID=A0ABS1VE44_9ACTN|nr:TetR/AcrR family transcriptional regulator [Actinoplanes lichenicola]MBL7252947.1 TetR/AcrR family transcriptional regulator [Actinoplanes lichenicola]